MSKTDSRFIPPDDSVYMGLSWFLASFSPNPSQQSGAVFVVNDEILSCGWNRPPLDLIKKTDWSLAENWIIDAEENAKSDWCNYEKSILYVTHMPNKSSILKLIKMGVEEIVYSKKNHLYSDDLKIIEEISRNVIKVTEFNGNLCWMQDWMLNLKYLNVFKKK